MGEEKTVISPRDLANEAAKALSSKRGREIRLLYIEKQTVLADYFVICTGTSNTQIRALADEVDYKLSELGCPPLRREGVNDGTWALLDFGSVIVHVFARDARGFYNLENLWNDAEEIDLSSILTEEE